MRTEIKVLAGWAASWAAGLGTMWLGLLPADRINNPDISGMFFVFIFFLSIAAAVAAWQAITRWWPE